MMRIQTMPTAKNLSTCAVVRQHIQWWVGLLVLLMIMTQAAAAEPEQPMTKLPIGMNLAGIADWEAGFPFKNLMWGARPWLTKNLDDSGPFNTNMGGKLPLDENGYPLELPYQPPGAAQLQYAFTIIPNVTSPGRYVVLYDGQGIVTAAMSSKVVSHRPGRLVLDLSCDATKGYEGIAIRASKRGDHVRNIRILREEDEQADLQANPFRDIFLEYCQHWHALRFMDWANTNNSLEMQWSGRKQRSFYTMVGQGGDASGFWGQPVSEFDQLFSGGVSLELMIQLANVTKCDAWFCVPHRATPEYMQEMATLIRDTLDPSLKVYLEYSNEVWNWQFQQAQWMIRSKDAADMVRAYTGKSAWKDGIEPTFPLEGGNLAREGGVDHPERMAALNRRCFEIFEKVFAGKDRPRLVRVIAVQAAWFDTAQRTTRLVMAHGGADALSPAGYFGPYGQLYESWGKTGAALTAEKVLMDLDQVIADNQDNVKAYGELAKKYQLQLLLYEAGQHLQPQNQQPTDYMPALKAAQSHPRMYDLYLRNIAAWRNNGCDLYMAFSSIGAQGTQWGSWGHQAYYGQPVSEAPKYRALLDANAPRQR